MSTVSYILPREAAVPKKHVCYGESGLITGGSESGRTCLFQRGLENGCNSEFRLKINFPPLPFSPLQRTASLLAGRRQSTVPVMKQSMSNFDCLNTLCRVGVCA